MEGFFSLVENAFFLGPIAVARSGVICDETNLVFQSAG